MNCERIREQFWEYQRQQLSGESLRVLEDHLQSCPACKTELAQFKSVDQMLEGWPALEPSPYFEQRLNARLADLEKPAASGLWSTWWKDRLVWTFAVLLLSTLGLWLGFRWQQGRQLDSMEAVIKLQDEYLGKRDPSPTPAKTEVAVKTAPTLNGTKENREETLNAEDESIPDEDLAIVENIDLLENYELLKKFDLVDVSAKSPAEVKAN